MNINLCIVEDLAEVREGLREFLSLNDEFNVQAVFDNAEASLEQLPVLAPDIVIMDINLPGMSGFEATRKLATWPETRDIPVIALSAAAMIRDAARVAGAGFYRYLTKPVKVDELTRVLDELLRQANDTTN